MVYTIWYISLGLWYIPVESGIYHDATFQRETERVGGWVGEGVREGEYSERERERERAREREREEEREVSVYVKVLK